MMPLLDLSSHKKKKGQYAHAEVDHLLRRGAYAERTDLEWQQCFRLPPWTEDDPYRFFEASEKYERESGYWGFTLRCSLPRTLPREGHIALAGRFLDTMFPAYAGLVVLHEPLAADEGTQPHVHILYSARLVDGYPRAAAHFFKRYDAKWPARGGAQKDPQVIEKHYPSMLYTAWCQLIKEHVEAAAVPMPAAMLPAPVLVADGPRTIGEKLSARAAGVGPVKRFFTRKASHAEPA